MWRVRDFAKYLIFYRTLEDRLEIERVIHAAQDYTRVMGP
jgi:plasmid stabilization system protein ParE